MALKEKLMRKIAAEYAFKKCRKGSKYIFKAYDLRNTKIDSHWDYASLLRFKQSSIDSKSNHFKYKMSCVGSRCKKCEHIFFCAFLLDEDGCI
jgi:hypothetical protein